MADGYDAGHPYNNEPHKIKNLLRTYLHLRYLCLVCGFQDNEMLENLEPREHRIWPVGESENTHWGDTGDARRFRWSNSPFLCLSAGGHHPRGA